MLKRIFVTLSLFVLCSCKPPIESKKIVPLNNFQCITSQSDCVIKSELVNVAIEFSQQQQPVHKTNKAGEVINNIKAEIPFSILLTLSSKLESKAIKVNAYLEGRDMFMGQVPLFFNQIDLITEKSEKSHINNSTEHEKARYQAESLLANCTEETMVWRLWVTVEYTDETNGQQNQKLFIDFTGERL